MSGLVDSRQTKLLQDKLDVRNKTRSNFFNWRGQFTPEFVDYVLESFAGEGDIVIDPFSGSGTVLLECSRKALSCHGFEVNPAAFVMSGFFSFANATSERRRGILSSLEKKISALVADFHDLPLFEEKGAYRRNYQNLLEFARELLSRIEGLEEKILALNTLFICEKKKGGVTDSILSSFSYMRRLLLSLPYTSRQIAAHLCDARLIHVNCPVRANVLFTSPPYINVFNYHQNYRAILEILGWDLLEIARSEIGSNRKNRSNRFRTVIQYCLDMEQALSSFWQCLADKGIVILVIGRESNVRRVPFLNGVIVKEIAERIGGYECIDDYERTFLNKFGNRIKEDIIVMRKGTLPPLPSRAKEVAHKHLRLSLASAQREVREDILDAINSIESVRPSPLFKNEGGII